MVDKDNRIMDMLTNILDKVDAVYSNMKEDDKIHYTYMLEKLTNAKRDLDILVEFARTYEDK